MTGPEHYREAERLIDQAASEFDDPGWRSSTMSPAERIARRDSDVALAQVHATLALAAATAGLDAIEGPNGGSATGRSSEDWSGWNDVISGGSDA